MGKAIEHGVIVDQSGNPFSSVCGVIGKRKSHKAATTEIGRPWWMARKPETADAGYLPDRDELVSLSRYQYNNCEQTRAALHLKCNMAVGSHVRIKPTPDASLFGIDGTQEREFVNLLKTRFNQHAKSKDNWFDASGHSNLYELCYAHLLQFLIDGEAMSVVKETLNPRGPLTFSLLGINTDRVYTPQLPGFADRANLVRGIQKNTLGLPLGYYVHNEHPSEAKKTGFSFVRRRNEFGRQQFIHSFFKSSADLTRGISDVILTIPTIQKKEKLIQAALESEIIKSELALVITSNKADAAEVLGAQGVGASGSEIEEYMESAMGHHSAMNLEFKGQQLARLYDGEKLEGFDPGHSGNELHAFCKVLDSISARAHGLSSEAWSQDWSDTNYSGARAGNLPIWDMVGRLRQSIPFDYMQRAYNLWLEDMILTDQIRLPGTQNAIEGLTLFYNNKERITSAEWYGPPKGEIDRAKTADAYLAEQGLGVHTHERYCNEVLGVDYEENMSQVIYEVKRMNEIMIDCGVQPLSDDELKEIIVDRLFGRHANEARASLRDSGAVETTTNE